MLIIGADVGIFRQRLSHRIIQDLKKRSLAGIIVHPIALSVVLFTDDYFYRHQGFSILFLTLVTGISIFRLILTRLDAAIPERHSGLSLGLFLGGILLTAFVWGLGVAVFMFDPGELKIQLLMVVSAIGICSGGATAYSPYFLLAAGYNALIIWPVILAMAVNAHNIPLAILFCIFTSYMFLLSFRSNSEYLTALDNEALLERKTKDLEAISNVDALTGLYNRRYFDTAFEVAWQSAVRQKFPLTLLICDIDYFKQINDKFGHPAGDEYLRTLSHHLGLAFKRQNDIVARYGGEEFIILLTNVTQEKAKGMAEAFRRTMEKTRLRFEGHHIQATVSIGMTGLIPETGIDRDIMISRADEMLYKAKAGGRNQVLAYSG